MRAILALIFAVLCSKALALTASECTEIKDKYNTISEKCRAVLGSAGVVESNKSVSEATNTQNLMQSIGMESDGAITAVQRQDNVFFTGGGSELDDEALAQIAMLAAVLKTSLLSDTCVRLVGHSDESGSTLINLAMSKRRAQAVAKVLSSGIGGERIVSVMGAGETVMLPNLRPTDPYQRRVEIHLKVCES